MPELCVLLGIPVELLHGITDERKALSIGESLEQSAELGGGLLQRRVALKLLAGVFSVVDNSLPVRSVLLEEVQEPLNGLLVVLVLLALYDDLCRNILGFNSFGVRVYAYLLASVDELVTTFLREVVLAEDLLRAVEVVVGSILVLLRDAIGHVILDDCHQRLCHVATFHLHVP